MSNFSNLDIPSIAVEDLSSLKSVFTSQLKISRIFIFFFCGYRRLLLTKYLALKAFGSLSSLIGTIFGLSLRETIRFSLEFSPYFQFNPIFFIGSIYLGPSALDKDRFPNMEHFVSFFISYKGDRRSPSFFKNKSATHVFI